MSQSNTLPSIDQLVNGSGVFLDSLDFHVRPKSLLQHCGLYAAVTGEPWDQQPWGYAILRTVYTPESDTLFPVAVKRIRDYVICSLMQGESNHGSHQYLYDEAVRRLDFPIVEDSSRLNNLALIEARPVFQEWLAGREGPSPRYSNFIVIDEVSMHDVVSLPEDPIKIWQKPTLSAAKSCVKFVQLVTKAAEGDEEFFKWRNEAGFMKCAVTHLFDLWYMQQDPTDFEHLIGEPGYEFGDDGMPLYLTTQELIAIFSYE